MNGKQTKFDMDEEIQRNGTELQKSVHRWIYIFMPLLQMIFGLMVLRGSSVEQVYKWFFH